MVHRLRLLTNRIFQIVHLSLHSFVIMRLLRLWVWLCFSQALAQQQREQRRQQQLELDRLRHQQEKLYEQQLRQRGSKRLPPLKGSSIRGPPPTGLQPSDSDSDSESDGPVPPSTPKPPPTSPRASPSPRTPKESPSPHTPRASTSPRSPLAAPKRPQQVQLTQAERCASADSHYVNRQRRQVCNPIREKRWMD